MLVGRAPHRMVDMSEEDEPDEPRCPRRQGPTALIRTFPKIGGFPELRSYRCIVCEEVVTGEREP
jgi:hypothetical protein